MGGFAGLAAVIVMGARIGRFGTTEPSAELHGQSIPSAALGVFILWIGWYGFNPGSQLAFVEGLNTNLTMLIAVNTTLAAVSSGASALVFDWFTSKAGKPNFLITLNGLLGGLVGITAGCDTVTNWSAIAIGVISGVLVVLGTRLLEKLKIDDGVDAWPVHGLCGIWGGISVGIFGGYSLGPQIIGCVVIPLWAFATIFIVFVVLDLLHLLRVKPSKERAGLDLIEHGQQAR